MSKRCFNSPEQMSQYWEDYKQFCDNQQVLTHEFSPKKGEFCSAELKRKVTYTIEGFCVWCKIPRSVFYSTYDTDPAYSDIVAIMREECEMDARIKFETGQIPTQLAGLWMSKHGYTTKTDAELKADVKGEAKTEQVIRFEGVLDEWSE